MNDILEFLFKYRPALFEQGEFAFGASRPILVTVLLISGLLLVLALWLGLRTRANTGPGMRALLIGLRVASLAIVTFCLLRPSLVLETVVPQESFVGVLVDDSQSMLINDGGSTANPSRAAEARSILDPIESVFMKELQERFKVRLFSFSDQVRRIESAADLTFSGGASDLGRALQVASDELAGTSNVGLVLLSDGADSTRDSLSDVLLGLQANQMPVRTVALGLERFARDVELNRVVAPRRVLKGSSLMVEVSLKQRGLSGESVTLEVEDEGRIVSVQEVELPTTGEAVTAEVTFTVTEPGSRRFRFKVPVAEGEQVEKNNQQTVLIEVLDERAKILYFEGEPRFELKFLRRAVEDDPNIQLVCLQRTAENKYLRLSVDGPDELSTGFPNTREELFQYRGLILGSVEASFFSYDQMRMIADFVSQRGGGFMMLGGRRSFSEGGYDGTPIADVLPVVLGPQNEGEPRFAEVDISLTAFGLGHPALQLDGDSESSTERWQALPSLSTFNPVSEVKAGATTLLTGSSAGLDDEQVVLAHQRFGRGRALALTVHDTWLWQMHHQIPLEDMTHETLWRQMLRWLVSYVPDQVTATTSHDRISPGESLMLQVDVRDGQFLDVNSANVTATLRSPSGLTEDLVLDWSVEQDGRFETSFAPEELGLWQLESTASSGGELLGDARATFEVAALEDEYFGAEQGADLMARIAAETGGRGYTLGELDELAEDLSHGAGGATVREFRDLWDMPILFFLLLLLLGSEWALRRARGLA